MSARIPILRWTPMLPAQIEKPAAQRLQSSGWCFAQGRRGNFLGELGVHVEFVHVSEWQRSRCSSSCREEDLCPDSAPQLAERL